MEKAQEAGGADNAVDYVEEDGGNKMPAGTQHNTASSASSASRNGTSRCRPNREERRPRVSPTGTLDASDPQIKQDVLSMIVQYLRSEKLFMAAVVIQDEANMKTAEQQARRAQGSRLRKATLEGDWSAVISLITKNLSRLHQKRFYYAVYRQEYLELIERQEYQRAFVFLNRRLKPMEATAASTPNEFLNLCYLLTCKSVSDAGHFRSWGGVLGGREKLAEELARLVEAETVSLAHPSQMPPNRLVTLLEQAVAFQIESGRYNPKEVKVFAGHEAGVLHAVSNPNGNLLVSGGRDSAIKFWDVMSGVCVKTLSQAVGAVTSVDLTMDGMYLLASSRHGPVRTWDVRMGRPLLRYKGHQNTSSSFLRATLGAEEGLVFGGSDDCKVYVWHRRETQQ
ncbi:conserved unknown protein [Ectocarpus siliculosus]|uniref:WD40 repeat-containing protein SMU1 n=1 Tax=Ectocarpus siliculosus TaxID=2880 RepID=D7G553_ECTSI|nr:conserved unknown protein [Ectocarpus siliculosus]|eukprot:CBJ33816.1 conserved unknown protein [Ectocarpus siliculosus]